MERPVHLLFVYGTLLGGEENHRLIEGSRCLGEAVSAASFELVDLGGFPGMSAGGSLAVVGELYEVDAEEIDILDYFEGHPDFFERTRVRLVDGREAHAYLLADARTAGFKRIESGDWRRYRAERDARPG